MKKNKILLLAVLCLTLIGCGSTSVLQEDTKAASGVEHETLENKTDNASVQNSVSVAIAEEETGSIIIGDSNGVEADETEFTCTNWVDVEKMQFAIDGKVYTLGKTKIQKLINDGVPFLQGEIESSNKYPVRCNGQGIETAEINIGENYFTSVNAVNCTDTDLNFSEATLSEVCFLNTHHIQDIDIETLTFPFPFSLTEEELVANAGEPLEYKEYVADDGEYISHTYVYGTKNRYDILHGCQIEFVNGNLYYVRLTYLSELMRNE